MSNASYSLLNNTTGEKIELPAISGTLGPIVKASEVFAQTATGTKSFIGS